MILFILIDFMVANVFKRIFKLLVPVPSSPLAPCSFAWRMRERPNQNLTLPEPS